MSASPPFLRLGLADPAGPVVIAVPHAGRDYPPELVALARAGRAALEALEDRWADLLAAHAAAAGATVFVAQRPRAWVDLNRGEREIDPAMIAPPPAEDAYEPTAKVKGGLGLIPRLGGGGAELWRAPFSPADVAARIAGDHRPWHAAVAAALRAAHARHGTAVLLDLHSMPPLAQARGRPAARLVFGDRHGRSAAPALRSALVAEAMRAGVPCALNVPYAGGYALDRHGAPAQDIHAVQVEVDRSLYLAPGLRAPGPRLAWTQALVARLADALARAAQAPRIAAAE